MGSTSLNYSGSFGLGVFGLKGVKLEQDMVGGSFVQNKESRVVSTHCQGFSSHIRRHETEGNRTLSVSVAEQFQNDCSNLGSTSSICPAPLSRQFWRAGNYDNIVLSNPAKANQYGTSYLRIHPKFLHSNATSHKWAFGAMAELLDNSVDEIQNGATFVTVDKTSNPRDGTPALLVQDNGSGMDPEAMRRCMSFGFSDKKLESAIGRYGNGFKTSSMRLGADAIVFSRHTSDRKVTQSVGLLSYTFLTQTQQDRIVVPMVDYVFNFQTGTWNTLQQDQQFKTNLSILLQWSPFTTEAELLKQFNDIGPKGTKIIIYNLWHDDEGKLELDFEMDSEDICLFEKIDTSIPPKEANQHHLANRLRFSLRAYLSVLYLRFPEEFSILLRGRVVEHHSIASGLKFPECILYKPHKSENPVITTIGFLNEAPAVNVHGFNVYHKNRLILPFWHVVSYHQTRGRGVVGVLEANFIEPTHNKQDFEKTPVFQRLETRLKLMTEEYWDFRCGLLGYRQSKKKAQEMTFYVSSDSGQAHNGIYEPVILDGTSQGLIRDPSTHTAAKQSLNQDSQESNSVGASQKRKECDRGLELERMKKTVAIGSRTETDDDGNDANHFEDQEAALIIQENKKLHARCQEYEKGNEELSFMVIRLKTKIEKAKCEYARLQIESRNVGESKQQHNGGSKSQ